MKIDEKFLALSKENRIKALSHFLIFFSMVQREIYAAETHKTETLIASNEVIHRAAKQLNSEITDNNIGYPYDIFREMLLEYAQKGGFEEILTWAMHKAFE